MGDELRGENLVHLNVRFSTETELKKIQDFLYEKSGQGVSFTGLVEAMANEVTIVTAVHNIKSNKGSKTAGVDKIKMDKYLQMPKDELILLIQSCFRNYRPKPARREYIEKSNGKKRPLGITKQIYPRQKPIKINTCEITTVLFITVLHSIVTNIKTHNTAAIGAAFFIISSML